MRMLLAGLYLIGGSLLIPAADRPRPVRTPSPVTVRPASTPSAARPIIYKPPRVGMPKVTVACGTRGAGENRIELNALAPEHEGWTAQESPVLWWHGSGLRRVSLEMTLVVPGRADPILMAPVAPQGTWHRIDLARHGIKLNPGVSYEWAVAAVMDPNERSKDVVASGRIVHMQPPHNLATHWNQLPPRERILDQARHGFWYDALSLLTKELQSQPADPELLQWGMSLCEQAGLNRLDFSDLNAEREEDHNPANSQTRR